MSAATGGGRASPPPGPVLCDVPSVARTERPSYGNLSRCYLWRHDKSRRLRLARLLRTHGYRARVIKGRLGPSAVLFCRAAVARSSLFRWRATRATISQVVTPFSLPQKKEPQCQVLRLSRSSIQGEVQTRVIVTRRGDVATINSDMLTVKSSPRRFRPSRDLRSRR